jgi:hypothetical protein
VWFGAAIFIAVTLSMLTSLGLLNTPFTPPFSFFFSYLRIFISPEYDVPVLAVIAIFPIALAFAAYFICFAAGRSVAKKLKPEARQEGQRIAMYITAICLIVSALASMLTALFLMGSGWILQKMFRYLIPIQMINFEVMCVLAIGLIILAWSLFKRVGAKFSNWIDAGIYIFCIATLVVFPSAASSLMIRDHMEAALLARGKEMIAARSRPIQSAMLYCEGHHGFFSCSIALYPEKWQNIELIGPWSLGYIKPGGAPAPKMHWRPRVIDNNTIPKVMLEPKKYITVEVSAPRNSICKKERTSIDTGDPMFFVRGRVIDEASNAAQDFRVHIANKTGDFSQMISAICET